MVSICPVCRKEFEILHPPMWRFKINSEYICSWGCLRRAENEGVEKVKNEIPKEAKTEAVRIAIEGGDPIEYLGKYSINPRGMWTYIRSMMKRTDPETFAKIPNLREKPPKKALRKEEAPKRPRKKPAEVQKPPEEKPQPRPELKKSVPELVLDVNGLRVGLKRETELKIMRVRSVKTGVDYFLSDDQERMCLDSGAYVFEMSVEKLPDWLNELPPICRQLGVKV